MLVCVTRCSLHQLEEAFRGPLAHQDHEAAGVERHHRRRDRGRVVAGAADERDGVGRPDVVGCQRQRAAHADSRAQLDGVGARVGELLAHSLRPSRRARRVEHDLARTPFGQFVAGVAVEQFGIRPETGARVDGEPGRLGERHPVGGRSRGVGELALDDQRLGAGVLEDVGDLRLAEVPVDGHEREPGLHRGPVGLDQLGAVRHHDGDRVAGHDAERGEAARGLVHARPEIPVGHRIAVEGPRARRDRGTPRRPRRILRAQSCVRFVSWRLRPDGTA